MELKLNGERAWTPAQVKYNFDGLYNEFCDYNAFMEAYNGLHDEVNTYKGSWVYYTKSKTDTTLYRTFLKNQYNLDGNYKFLGAFPSYDYTDPAQQDPVNAYRVLYQNGYLDGTATIRKAAEDKYTEISDYMKEIMEEGKYDFNTPTSTPTPAPTLAPVSPEVPQ